jgi:hypothetical protein
LARDIHVLGLECSYLANLLMMQVVELELELELERVLERV